MAIAAKVPEKKRSKDNTHVLIDFPETAVMQVVFGAQDGNLRWLEDQLEIQIGRRQDGISISGLPEHVALAGDLLSQLIAIVKNGDSLFAGDLERAFRLLSRDRSVKLTELFREQIKVSGKRYAIVPKSPTQKKYIEAIRSKDVVFGVGPAGTGKTYVAMAMAVSALLRKQVKRLVLCRPAVEAGEKLGFLPGDMADKVNPYLRPLYDALHDMVDSEKAQEWLDTGIIEVAPLAFMRGRTLSNAFVILDEAQNTTGMQMKMILTRLGLGSKCIITGDVTQIDLPRGQTSGLVEALDLLEQVKDISIVHFSGEEIIRHPLVSAIVAAYERKQKV